MSTQRQATSIPADSGEPLSDRAVAEFLADRSDFFEHFPALLEQMRLPHSTGGAAVSLVERQVALLRQRNAKLERKLKELVSVARTNESLSGKIHELALDLIGVADAPEALAVIERSLEEDFGAHHSVLVLFYDGDSGNQPERIEARFVAQTERSDPGLKPFQTFLHGARPRCGQMRDAQRDFLFGRDNLEIGSAALVPLGENSELGLLAIGHREANHFHPAMSTDFLVRLGEIVYSALRRFPPAAA